MRSVAERHGHRRPRARPLGPWFAAVTAVAVLGALAGCDLAGGPGAAPYETGQADQALYGLGTIAQRWPSGIVPVCWSAANDHAELHALAQQVAQDSWPAVANIQFVGWAPCTPLMNGVKHATLAFSTTPDFRGNASSLGYGSPVVTLVADDPRPHLERFRYEVVHELGHALGFAHEMKRPDNWIGTTPQECGVPASDPDYPNYSAQPGGLTLTSTYDIHSIMNYGTGMGPGCNPIAFPAGLSDGDSAGASRPQAYGPWRGPVVTGELLDPSYVGAGGTDPPSALRIRRLVPASDGSGAWSLAVQDIALDAASSHPAHWQPIGDLNGDGRPDLVAPIFLGPPAAPPPDAPPSPSGLRIATALSAGADGWSLVTQDVAPEQAVDDTAGWKIAGDLNGDGRLDLFDAVYLGQPGDGTPSGLRIHTLLSTGPGTWAFTSQDVAPDYAVPAAPHWQPAGDLDGDGHPDLFDTAYLPADSNGNRTGLRVFRALWTGIWTLSSQDVAMPVTPADLGTWRAGVFNGNHRPDLVTLHALGEPSSQVLAIVLHSSPDGTWTTEFKALSSTGVIENLASWRVADINGDGQSDLVSASLLAGGTGLRIRTAARATALLGFSTGSQDVSATYVSSDTATWNVLDINGDGLADLVDVAHLAAGADSPGGLRISAAISHGDGNWTFTSQDVAADGNADDATGWHVAEPAPR